MASRAPLPTGTVTFLFTDIEGSTRLVHQLGNRFEAVLERHHALLREVFASAGGIEVATEGDAFFEVFDDATAAVAGAAAAQRALAAEDWGEGVQVRVRMGIHTGTGKLVGDNYGGIDVHRAARVSSAGHGGQVLLSETTAALVAHSLGEGIRLIDLGEHRLKDLERPERLHQLSIEGLRNEFPPPKARAGTIHNLPPGLTPFIGRSRELDQVTGLLETSRILTLTGPGGTGKTRLSLAVAERALSRFPDGVFIVFLAPVRDDMLVPSTIAQALGLREQGATPAETTLKEYLSDKAVLLVLDNFEQVVSAAGFVSQLAGASPDLRIVVSSRVPLRVAGEQEYAVPPMTIPAREGPTSLEALSQYEAIDLFLSRASALKPGFELTEENAAPIAEICRRLDGLPLAIELAAARLRVMSPQEMVGRLDEALALLTGGGRDLPERQQTLRGAIAWSYDLLDDDLKRFFRALGTFTGGFTLEAAELVADPERQHGLEGLETMIDNSLVRHTETEQGTSRFRMLETIREFALECLRDHGEEGQLRDRHKVCFLNMVEESSPKFTMSAEAPDATEAEHDNVRAALRWAIDSGDADTALRLGAALWRFWQLRSHLAEGRRWLVEILDMPGAAEKTALRARTAMALGSITYWQNDFDETRARYEEALEGFRAIGDDEGVQEALYNVGFVWLLEHDPEPARAMFEESRSLAQARADKLGLANTAWGLAMTAVQERDWDGASQWGAECARAFEELNDAFGRTLARFVHFQIARFAGRFDEARALGRAFIEGGAHDSTDTMSAVEMIAEIELQDGDLEWGLRLAAAAAAFRDEYGGGSPAALVELSDPRELAARTLPPDRIEELWAEGYSMPRDEVVAYALGKR